MATVQLPYGVSVPEAELEVRAVRSSGPGGQSVNTTDSKVELRWDVATSTALSEQQRARLLERLGSRLTSDGVLILTGSEHKSQHRNRAAVLARFRSIVGEALAPPRQRRRTRPTRASKQRRLDQKRRRGETKRLRQPPSD
ncbi:MAG: aminoacyl-tRNA hydrolase [Nitriliruptor sp.]|nr:MAG: aminoacyl-tRNA hydrolase [Nitriliruptor sp.]